MGLHHSSARVLVAVLLLVSVAVLPGCGAGEQASEPAGGGAAAPVDPTNPAAPGQSVDPVPEVEPTSFAGAYLGDIEDAKGSGYTSTMGFKVADDGKVSGEMTSEPTDGGLTWKGTFTGSVTPDGKLKATGTAKGTSGSDVAETAPITMSGTLADGVFEGTFGESKATAERVGD